jgi:putative transposase
MDFFELSSTPTPSLTPEQIANCKRNLLRIRAKFQSMKNDSLKRTYSTMQQNNKTLDPKAKKPLPQGPKKYFPYWNSVSKEWADKLLLPTNQNSTIQDSTLWNRSLKRLGLDSWFTVIRTIPKKDCVKQSSTSLMNISESSLSLSNSIMNKVLKKIEEREQQRLLELTKNPKKKRKTLKNPRSTKPPAETCCKIRLYPNKNQKQKLSQWFGAVRWTYNECLKAIKHEGVEKNMKALRNRCINDSFINKTPKFGWLKEVHYDVRDEGMRDLFKAYNTCEALKGTQKHYEISYRKKKLLDSESIVIHAKYWKKSIGKTIAHSFLHHIQSSEPLPKDLVYDSRLVWQKPGHYYLCIPKPLSTEPENQGLKTPEEKVVASIDPGVRTFATVYDTTGVVTEWGKGDISRIYRLSLQIDKLVGIIDKEPEHHKRWNKRKALNRLQLRIKNLVTDMHHKFAKWLCENYKVILLPKFDTQSMVRKSTNGIFRKIKSITARQMMTWSHYLFRTRLLDKIKKYKDVKCEIVDEAYTSKTCVNCGHIHEKLGGNRVFSCPQCKIRYGRDHGAAKGILLRFLSI